MPLATTLSVVDELRGMVTLCGCVVIAVAAFTVTFALLVVLHPEAVVTVTVIVIVPPLPAVYERLRPFADVIVPPLTCQSYVAPAPASATLATPAVSAQSVEGAVMAAAGSGLMAMAGVLDVALQPDAVVTVTLSDTLPLAPALNETLRPLAEAIVPPVICQTYVAPAPASATLAAPAAFAQIDRGAVMAASGVGLMAIDALPVALHPAAVVTVTLSDTLPPAPALNETSRPLAEVIVPPLICQTYVAPAPASAALALPVAPAQISAGAAIVADGFAFTVTATASLGALLQPRESVTTT